MLFFMCYQAFVYVLQSITHFGKQPFNLLNCSTQRHVTLHNFQDFPGAPIMGDQIRRNGNIPLRSGFVNVGESSRFNRHRSASSLEGHWLTSAHKAAAVPDRSGGCFGEDQGSHGCSASGPRRKRVRPRRGAGPEPGHGRAVQAVVSRKLRSLKVHNINPPIIGFPSCVLRV